MLSARNSFIAAGLGLIGSFAMGLPAVPVMAATATSTFQVTATVTATCLIAANPLAFGAYTGTVSNASTTISVTCTNTTPYNIGLDAGTSSGATVSARKMTGPASATLGYGLFRDSAHTQNWGNTIGTDTQTGTGNGSAQSLTVFGQIAAGQFVAPGSYSDTITATITY